MKRTLTPVGKGSFLYFRHEVYRLPLVLIDYLRVYLSCADVAVTEKLGDGVEVCSVSQSESGEGMAAAVFCFASFRQE